ncbi:putative ankyrin repeat protein RBE_0220 [Cloeon dipterum]|uniref:putative ankyrin repeat protein RBE_0220 n=1 Tax=Cloeon dipterum TaxID=197152 RepID=UPI00321FB25F
MQNGNGIHYLPEFDNSVPLGDKISYIADYKDEIPALLFAAKVADEEVCGRLKDDLERDGVDIGAMVDENDANVFHYIAKNASHGEDILALFDPSQYHSKINEEDGNNETAITIALRAKNFGLACKLNEFLKENIGSSPTLFYYCLVRFDVSLMSYVLMKDPSLAREGNEKRSKDEILSAAVQYRDLVTCRSLIDCFTIEYLKQGTYWKDCLVLYDAAVNKKHGQEIARFLLNNYEFDLGAPEREEVEPLKDGYCSPLVNALLEGHVGVAEELLNHGADIKVKTNGKNLLQICVEENELESASFLHRKDGTLLREKNDDDDEYSIFLSISSSPEIFAKWLFEQEQDQQFLSAFLHFIVFCIETDVAVEIIREHLGSLIRPIVNLADMSGKTPLHAALSEGKLEVAEALIENGADMKVKLHGENLLLFCVAENQLESAQFVHAKDRSQILGTGRKGETALQLACLYASSDIETWLQEEIGSEGEENAGPEDPNIESQ